MAKHKNKLQQANSNSNTNSSSTKALHEEEANSSLSMHWAGFLLFFVNIWPSYQFYNLNTHKLFMVEIGLLFLCFLEIGTFAWLKYGGAWRKASRYNLEDVLGLQNWHFQSLTLLLLITLATLPGLFLQDFTYNYYFPIEFTSNTLVVLYAFMVMRRTRNIEDIKIFLKWAGVLVIYSTAVALIEKAGFYIFEWRFVENVDRPVSVHGNPAYFAGMLSMLFTFFFIYVVLRLKEINFNFKKVKEDKELLFFVGVVVACFLANQLLKTRTLMIAFSASVFSCFVLYLWLNRKNLSLKAKLIFVGFFVSALLVFVAFDALMGWPFWERIRGLGNLYYWAPRFNPWKTALTAIFQNEWTVLFGYGLGASYSLFFKFVNPDLRFATEERSYSHVHNEWLEMTEEGGLLVMIAFFILWAVIIRNLVRVIKHHQSGEARNLAIAMMFGFMGYHIYSMACVSPRMMTLKLPLYAMVGLSFALYYISVPGAMQTKPALGKVFSLIRKKGQWPLMMVMPFILGLTTYLAYPWFYSMSGFTVFLKNQGRTMDDVKVMEDVERKYPNVYVAENLARVYFTSGNWRKSIEWLDEANRLVPYFRETKFFKAQALSFLGEKKEALAIAKEYQAKDNFYLPVITFMLSHAIEENDFAEFKRQLELFSKKSIVSNQVFYFTPFSTDMLVEFKNGLSYSMNVEKLDNGKVLISISEDRLAAVFNELVQYRRTHQGGGEDKKENQQRMIAFFNSMMQSPFFHKKFIIPATPEINKLVDEKIAEHQKIEYLLTQKEMERNQKMQSIIRGIDSRLMDDQIKSIEMGFKTEIAKMNDEKIKNEEKLNEYIDFKTFNARMKFANFYANTLYVDVNRE